jgi:chemotaxis protein MotB
MARKKVEKAPNHERWLLTYADMITLLMIFFIILYSMSRQDVEKFKAISASLSRAFNVDVSVEKESASPPSRGESSFDTRMATYIAVKSQVGAIADSMNVSEDVSVRLSREGVLITVSGNFLFESGRADVRADAYPVLDTIITQLRDLPNELRISGHTDDVPIESPLYASNWELSSARAIAVVKYMTAAGVTAERMSAAGYGEFRPVVPNDSRANRAKNRRAELLIIFPEGSTPSDDLLPAAGNWPPPSSAPSPAGATPAVQEHP